MHFKQIGKNRYRVERSPTDDSFIGTVEKQEYDSINMATGARTKKRFWRAFGVSGGWKATSKRMFGSREEAAAFLIKDSKLAYADRDMQWTKRQGESAALKEAKAR
jgi:hypothetical protein